MSRAGTPFSTRGLLALVVGGTALFLLLLYAIGAGWNGSPDTRGTERADSNALNGFSALAAVLEARGHTVEVARGRESQGVTEAGGWTPHLLILTPSMTSDGEDLAKVLEDRRYQGPTIVILPKWLSQPSPPRDDEGDRPRDWVRLQPGYAAEWFEQVPLFAPLTLGTGQSQRWQGLDRSGPLADPAVVQAITEMPGKELLPLVSDSEGDLLAGYWNRGGWHPDLAEAGGIAFNPDEEDGQDSDIYPLVLVAEPDLFNNYGLASEARAGVAVEIIEATMAGEDMDVVFDMQIDGLGGSENLLTLAFRPPFLAATLCLIAVLLVIGWRAFRRFGPPLAEAPEMAHGKTRLASNGAALIQRARRWHLLGAPYAALVTARLAAALHVRAGDEAAREAAIDAAQTRHGNAGPLFSSTAQALRNARRLPEVLRAAGTLRSIERTLTK